MFTAKNEIVIDANNSYAGTVFFALVIAISQLLISGITFIVYLFIIDPKAPDDIHILLCTLAYNVIIIQGVLSLNFVNGWSRPIKLKHRAWVHGFMMISGLSISIAGLVCALETHKIPDEKSFETHGEMGVATTAFGIASACVGIGAIFSNQYWKIGHIVFGLPTYVLSSICFCQGLLKPCFKEWAGEPLIYILVAFVVFYTLFIFLMAFIKFIMRILVELGGRTENDDEEDDD